MRTQEYDSTSIRRFWEKRRLLLVAGLVLVLAAIPSVVPAATPWYSHGRSHTLTLTEDGQVWSMGGNEFGQLGNGTFGGEVHEPRLVKGLDGIVSILAVGDHSVALKNDGTVWIWGFNGSGQPEESLARSVSIPSRVATLDHVQAITTGNGQTVALQSDGTVWAWGNIGLGLWGTATPLDGSVHPIRISGCNSAVDAAMLNSVRGPGNSPTASTVPAIAGEKDCSARPLKRPEVLVTASR